jgi:energy-coupling factor transporter ATP-binding protein EcfA2
MRLARLKLKHVGPFEEATFEIPEPKGPGELVLFEGPNGSGKTTIVEAIAVLLSGFWKRDNVSADDAAQRMQEISWLCAMPPLRGFLRRRRGPAHAAVATLAHDGDSMDVHLAAAPPLSPIYGQSQIFWSKTSDGNAVAAKLNRFGTWIKYDKPVEWAAFAYQAHQPSAELATAGPRDIDAAPLSGALSLGAHLPESSLLGQLLANLENERTKALAYASERTDERRGELAPIAESRQAAIRRFERVFSEVLGRRVAIEFSIDRQAPAISFDGDLIPLELLGEGLRSTMAWLSDLLVRLERVRWADIARSPVDQDFWLILDEIDEGLHPTMQARILPALRELFPNARIYATTHSPFVVASAGQGTIFPIRPAADHRVRGAVEPMTLEPGQSLEWVVTEIFEAQAGFVDQKTRGRLDAHKRDVRRLQRGGSTDWDAFLARRAELMALNDEVRTVVAMQEVPVRAEVDRRLRAGADAESDQAGG